MIQFDCPQCGKTLKVKDSLSGKRGKCPHCNSAVEVPAKSEVAAEPQDIPDIVEAPAGHAGWDPVEAGPPGVQTWQPRGSHDNPSEPKTVDVLLFGTKTLRIVSKCHFAIGTLLVILSLAFAVSATPVIVFYFGSDALLPVDVGSRLEAFAGDLKRLWMATLLLSVGMPLHLGGAAILLLSRITEQARR